MIKPKNLLKGITKTALKVSPIPIPDFVEEQLGLHNNEMKLLSEKIDRLEEKLDNILDIVTEFKSKIAEQG